MPDAALVLSPHLDDAVLSLGGWIASRCDAGIRVVAATVFSDGGDRALYEARRAEDERALAILGAERRLLDFPDAPYRPGGYTSFERLVLAEHHDDGAIVTGVGEQLRALVAELAPSIVLAPLAVGTHIDHRLVHAAARATRAPNGVLFYEDRPYCHVRHATAARLAELGWLPAPDRCPGDVDVSDPDRAVRGLVDSFRATPHVRTFAPRRASQDRILAPLERALRDAAAARSATASCDTVTYDEAIAQRVGDAVCAYTSQVPLLFGGDAAARSALRDHSGRIAPGAAHAERLWRP